MAVAVKGEVKSLTLLFRPQEGGQGMATQIRNVQIREGNDRRAQGISHAMIGDASGAMVDWVVEEELSRNMLFLSNELFQL